VPGGIAAAAIQRTRNGTVSYEETTFYQPAGAMFAARPIAIGSDKINLILFGTGFDSVLTPASVTVATTYTANSVQRSGAALTVESVGPLGTVPGVDQITIPIPSSYAGTGVVTFTLTIAGQPVNTVTVDFQ
jgi:uncharacterized protein (TIGR03437 family)